MQGLILAAGMGTRLKSYTKNKPKILMEVQGICLLTNALDQLVRKCVTETIIVVGYKKELVIEKIGFGYHGMKITYVENTLYETTNNIYSFYLAQNYIHDDVIMLEGDLLYNYEIIDKVCDMDAECTILVSKFNPDTMNGTVILADEDGRARSLVLKDMQDKTFDYSNAWKTVNIYKMKRDFIKCHLFPAIELYIKTEDSDSYYEKVLGSLIYYNKHDIWLAKVKEEEWFEIDDETDLNYAVNNFVRIQ